MASTGILISRDLPFTTCNRSIKKFRHALALDEHRAKFVPTFWHIQRKGITQASNPSQSNVSVVGNGAGSVADSEWSRWIVSLFKRGKSRSSAKIKAEWDPEEEFSSPCDVKEVWFVGAHCGKSKRHFFLSIN